MSNKTSSKVQPEKTDRLKCGLIMPISAIDGCTEGHWEEVRNIINEALSDTDFDVSLVSDSNEIGIIQNRIVTNIYKSDMVICDVSGKNPNVMFELGMRLAFDKPTLIIKDDHTNYSFDTSPIEHITYRRDLHYHSIMDFKDLLRTKFLATYNASLDKNYTTFLKHFGDFRVAEVTDRTGSSETYILEVLETLTTSVNNIYSSLNKSPDSTDFYSAHNTKRIVDPKNIAVFSSLRFNNLFDAAWIEYKDKNGINEISLRDKKILTETAHAITRKLSTVIVEVNAYEIFRQTYSMLKKLTLMSDI